MSQLLQQARDLDRLNRPKEACEAYLRCYEEELLPSEDLINAAVLLAQLEDFGFFSTWHFAESMRDISCPTALKMLYEVRSRCDSCFVEACFWLSFLNHVFMGGEQFMEEAKEWLAYSKYPIIALPLENEEYRLLAQELWAEIHPGKNEKERMVLSILRSAIGGARHER